MKERTGRTLEVWLDVVAAMRGVRRMVVVALACVILALGGCGGGDETRAPVGEPVQGAEWGESRGSERPADTVPDSVTVVFTKDEAPAPVRRPVPKSTASPLRAALEWLVRGPTPEERAAGIGSWFSDETVGVLRSVELDSSGKAIVDFSDLRPLIPNASSSFGSTMLLQELNGTVFQFSEIDAVEYRMEGSCDLFWDWLQYGCHVVRRESR